MNAAPDINRISSCFSFNGEKIGDYIIDNGHINDTFVVEYEQKDGTVLSYLLQRINVNVFKNPQELMSNILGVTDFLRDKIEKSGGDTSRECLTVIPTLDGKSYAFFEDYGYWRAYNFITDSYTANIIGSPEVFYNAARAFGRFQNMLAEYPIDTLFETIPNFHNTVSRFADFEKAVSDNLSGRLDSARAEADFILSRKEYSGKLLRLLEKGRLPLRVTHNDTKLNNVMFDRHSGEGVCVVDLDTVMPGLSLYDFGDSIRFGANTASEDEQDISKVSIDLTLFKSYVKGYLLEAGSSLTEAEINNLAFSSILMTYECGMRFLGDYINGDTYFKVSYPEHNLVRARTQIALVEDMERKFDEMKNIVNEENNRIKNRAKK